MFAQRIGSVELDTTIAAESSAPSESLAASIPPELFKDILAYVGDKARLGYDEYSRLSSSLDSDARREEIKYLSACALTCVYWAQLTRGRMFQELILRSSKDMSGLLSLLRAPQSPRIPPIRDIILDLYVFYTLGDHPWFHNLADLQSRYRISNSVWFKLYITGPATPAFVAASTRGSMLHPLFFATPKVLPVTLSKGYKFMFHIQNIHLPNPTMLSNLVQDCLSLLPRSVECTNLTWDVDPVLQATPSSIGMKYACRTADGFTNEVSGCTDDILVAAMLESVPHHEFFQPERRQGTYLSPLETSFLFDVMRTTWGKPSSGHRRTGGSSIWSYSGLGNIQKHVAVRLSAGTDFSLVWQVNGFEFRSIASPLPHAPATSNNIRNITYIFIDLWRFDVHLELRRHMKTANIVWDTFLHTVRQFPHLRQIVIQRNGYGDSFSRRILVEFLAHLSEAWFGLGKLLGLYCRDRDRFGAWVQLRLDTLMDEIKQRREEIKAEADTEKAASSEPESNVVEEVSEGSTHTGNE